ncbi:MAG: hypothetical protein COA44_15195 [Arcobacter sp.]|nr:MAG: hypothetical protein COA44_15195 [Arcobacter sp.]
MTAFKREHIEVILQGKEAKLLVKMVDSLKHENTPFEEFSESEKDVMCKLSDELAEALGYKLPFNRIGA